MQKYEYDISIPEQRKHKLIILGTGSCYTYCKTRFSIDVENEVLFFVESNAQTDHFQNKKIINYTQLEQYLEHSEQVDILICTTAWDIIQKNNSFNYLYKHALHPVYIETLFENSALLKFHQPFLDLVRQGIDYTVEPTRNSNLIVIIKEFKGAALVYHHLTIGILLKMRGYEVEYLFCDESIIGDFLYGEGFNKHQNELLLDVLKEIKTVFNIDYQLLSQQAMLPLNNDQQQAIDRVIYYNLVWSTQQVFYDKTDSKVMKLKQYMLYCSQKVNGFIQSKTDITSFAFTGVHHEWAIWFELASLANKGDIFTFEQLTNGYLLDKNMPAIYRKNIFKEVENRKLANTLHQYDFLSKQRIKIAHNKPVAVIPLNIFWDSAAYTQQDIYLDFGVWLIRTIDYLLNECQAIVYVRQHPHESQYGSGKDVQQKLHQYFGEVKEYHFIDCESTMNTYDLVHNADVVLPNTSTVGVEAVIMGKPVILKNDVYFGEYGFAHRAYTEQEYHALIKQALDGKLPVEQQQREAAANCFTYVVHNGRETYFGHADEEIEFWIQKSWSELLQDNEVNFLLNSIIERKPYSDWDSLFTK
ncbi:hypothetical protein [Paenibacillus campi]|uniref:capsular polysaccharide export protein, LipB/KpsS family n=1 Tax=Paenibacillus campi TaxID=3106031 RepID=UPI002AFDDF44|nr:hypothetical protein [Paenibacillus sp. SGZ-1014]